MSQAEAKQSKADAQAQAHSPGSSSTKQRVRLQVVSQAFRYCDYGAGQSLSRSVRLNAKPIQFVVNTWCDTVLQGKEVEIGVEIRDRATDEPVFETFWVTTLAYQRQQSSFIFRELPPEMHELTPGDVYTYYASAMVNETDDFAERTTRVSVR